MTLQRTIEGSQDVRPILIISYYFPPDGGAGTQRAAKFCRHLPAFGCQPHVLTREPATRRSQWEPEDRSLLEDTASTHVARVAPRRNLSGWESKLPHIDVAHSWIGPAFERAREIIQSNGIEAVLVTMSPFDLSYLGQRLKSTLGVRVIYDLRDPWALDGWRLYPSKRRWHLDFRVMKETLATADGIIMNTPQAMRSVAAIIPQAHHSRLWVIPNGYDNDDFVSADTSVLEADAPMGDGNFYLVHTGTFHSAMLYKYRGVAGKLKALRHYRPEPLLSAGRTPYYLLQAVKLLADRRHPLYSKLRIIFVGQEDDATCRCIAESGVAKVVRNIGYVPHKTSVAWLRRANALFLPLHGLKAGARSLIIPGKTYEYLASGSPILGTLPNGDARELVQRSGNGFVADPCDAEQISQRLIEMLDLWGAGRLARGPAEWVAQYERRPLAAQLAKILQ